MGGIHMNSNDVADKLIIFFQDNILYNESVNDINFDESLIDRGYIDSIGIITLVTFIEDAFTIRVYDHEILPQNFESLNRIIMYVNQKLVR